MANSYRNGQQLPLNTVSQWLSSRKIEQAKVKLKPSVKFLVLSISIQLKQLSKLKTKGTLLALWTQTEGELSQSSQAVRPGANIP